jgi:hypothetical protein
MPGVITATIDGKPVTAVVIFSNMQGDKMEIDLVSSMPWQVTHLPAWLEMNYTHGDGAQKVTVTVIRDNNSDAPLNGEIVILAANGDMITIKVQQEEDRYIAFKADDTPRWEIGATVEKNANSKNTFISDFGGKLLTLAKHKTGRITTPDGSSYEIVEFNGPAAVGKPTGAAINKASAGSVPLYSLRIVQVVGNKLWIVFKETESAPERRVVQ